MAERVPIWYDVQRGQSISAETYQTVQNAAEQLHRELNLSVAIALADGEGNGIKCIASSGPAAPPIGTVSSTDGICAACVRQNRLQLSSDTAADPMVSGELCERLRIRSILSVPLRRGSRCLGFVAAFSDAPHRFDLALIGQIRSQAAAIEESLNLTTVGFLNPSTRAISKQLECRRQAKAPIMERSCPEESSSESRSLLSSALAAHLRPASIAALTFCTLLFVAVLPRAARSKSSAQYGRTTETSGDTLHADHAEVGSVAEIAKTADSRLSELWQGAASGDVRAQTSLAARYEKGDGVERDSLKACVWYIIAGANGDLAAKDRAVRISHRLPQFQIAEIRFNVGTMYMRGSGVKRDLVGAYSWFALAQAAGDIRARDQEERLEAAMSREQVSEALRKASDWLLAHHSGTSQHTRELAAISQSSRSAR